MKTRNTAAKKARPPALTHRQERFVAEYLVDLNGTQAAIRAGYSKTSASKAACRLLAGEAVRKAVGMAMDERMERTGLSQDEVIEDLRELRDICMGRKPVKVMTIVKNAKEGTAESVEVEGVMFEPSSANRALELLGRHMRMFSDRPDAAGGTPPAQSGVLVVPPVAPEDDWEKDASGCLSRNNQQQEGKTHGQHTG